MYGLKVTSVFYDFSIESSWEVFMRLCSYSNVLYLRFWSWKQGGGVMDFVYSSSSSSYMNCEVNFVVSVTDSPI